MPKTKRAWIILGAAVGVLLIGFFVVLHFLDADTYRGRIEAVISDSLGRPARLGHLDFSVFSGGLVAEAPSISDDPAFSNQPFLTAKDVRIGVEIAPLLFHHQLHITSFTIDRPAIVLLRAQNGVWNYSSLAGEGKRKTPTAETTNLLPDLTVGRIDIKDATVTVGTMPQQGNPHVYSDLNVSMRNFSPSSTFPFTVDGKLPGGGSLDIRGNAGPVNQHDASLTPLTAQVSLKHADLVAAGFVEPSQGIAGIADLDTRIVSNGRTAQANGKLRLNQLKLARNGTPSSRPVDMQFSIHQDLQSLSGRIEKANLQIAQATLAMTGIYQARGNTTTMQISLNGQNMPIDEIEAFLPSLGLQMPSGSRLQGGTLTTTLNVSGPTTSPVVSGPVRIADTQLTGFDLGKKLASIQSLTGARTGPNTKIQALSTDLHYGSDGTRTDNLVLIVPGLGTATGAGVISPASALNYHLLVKLSSSGMGGLATQALSMLPGAFGSVASETTRNGIPVIIGGTTSNPTFVPDMSKMATQGLPQTQSTPANPLGKLLGGLIHH